MAQRRDIDVRLAAGDKLGEACVEAGIFLLIAGGLVFAVDVKLAAALARGQPSGIGIDMDIPGLRAALPEVEISLDRCLVGVAEVNCAAIGAWRFSGTCSVAWRKWNACGRIAVTIGSALMPGSNTPMPPGSKIHA